MAAFIEGPMMMVYAVRAASGRPALARALGARVAPHGDEIAFFASESAWPEATGGLAPGAPLALTVCDPSDYRTYQFKGPILNAAAANVAERAVVGRYVAGVVAVLEGLGIQRGQIDHWITPRDLIAIRFRPVASFSQTPGAEAGRALAGTL